MHTAGEPVRIVTGGYPELDGRQLLAKRRDARDNHDHLRRAMMLEPRGHAGMYGVIPVRAFASRAPCSACCSPTTRAIPPCAATPRWRSAAGWSTRVSSRSRARDPLRHRGALRPAGAHLLGRGRARSREVRSRACRPTSLRWTSTSTCRASGASSTDIGMAARSTPSCRPRASGSTSLRRRWMTLVAAGGALTDVIRARRGRITHPDRAGPRLPLRDHPDRRRRAGRRTAGTSASSPSGRWTAAPTGSGVTARMALDSAKGLLAPGQTRVFRGISGGPFTGRVPARPPRSPARCGSRSAGRASMPAAGRS